MWWAFSQRRDAPHLRRHRGGRRRLAYLLLVGGDSWLKAGGFLVAVILTLARLAIGAIMVIRRGRLRAAPRARHRSARWRGAPRDMRIMEPATTSHAMTVVVQEVEAGGAAPPTKPMATSRGAEHQPRPQRLIAPTGPPRPI
jgi:hypothetical protein